MLSFFSNITQIMNYRPDSIIYKFLKLNMFINVSFVYAFCLLVICLCLYWNTKKNNLIYKVLNLAVLSVFVAALWSYLTDVTFIYIVYILTFVSAVVMLFLSVVLMLPSSAVYISKKNVPFLFLLYSDVSYVYFILVFFFIAVFYECILILSEKNTGAIFKIPVLQPGHPILHKLSEILHTPILFETVYQAATYFSIYTLAIPYGNFNTKNYSAAVFSKNYFTNTGGLENLAFIQYEIYVNSPILILVCVVGLLIALIGAALLVSTKIINNK